CRAMVPPICDRVGKPDVDSPPPAAVGSLPISFMYSICSGVSVTAAALFGKVARCHTARMSPKISSDSKVALKRWPRHQGRTGFMAASGALDREAAQVGLGLGRIESLAHDLEARVGRAIGRRLAQGLHVLFGIGQQEDLLGQLLVVD